MPEYCHMFEQDKRYLEAMMFRKILFRTGLAAAVTLGSALPLAAESFNYLFSIRLGIVQIGEMRIKGDDQGGRYETSGKLYTTGLAGALYNVAYTYSAAGNSTNRWRLMPKLFTAKIFEDGKTRTEEIRYNGDRIMSINGKPPKESQDVRGSVDPMTLIYILVRPVPKESVCGGSFVLFDGSTRFDVSFVNARKYNDGRVTCDVKYGGKAGGRGVAVSGVTYEPGDDGWMYIRNFAAETSIGTLKATLR